MKLNRSVLIALGAIFLIGAWFLFRSLGNSEATIATPTQSQAESQTKALPQVVTEFITAQSHDVRLQLYGRTEANREVSVKAETAGLVARTPAQEGQPVKRGDVLCQQDVDARQAMVEQAEAQLKTAELEHKANVSLVEKGFRSETQVSRTQASLDGARAALKQAQIERGNVYIRAPFAGVFETRMAEIGDYLGPGQPCGTVVEMNPLLVVGQLTERQLSRIETGQTAKIMLATGQTVDGTVRLIDTRANPSTRSFRIELEVPNPEAALRAGVTATIELQAGSAIAHRVPSHILSINDAGIVGVRYVDEQNIVRFVATETIDEDDNGAWVTGLPETAHIIVKGQDFVAVGTEVDMTRKVATQ